MMKAEDLKNSILQMAMQGKLVPQNPEDEPATKLLEKIKQEKEQLIKEGKIKRNKNESTIWKEDEHWYEKIGKNGEKTCVDEEISYDIPDNWMWCSLEKLIYIITGISYKKGDITTKGIRILRGGNIQNDKIYLLKDDVFLPEKYFNKNKELKKNDIVIVASTGSKKVIGKPGFVEDDVENMFTGAFLRTCRPIKSDLFGYLKIIFSSEQYRKHIRNSVKGTNINNIKKEYIEKLKIPLPPLNEQKRIVEKLEQILPQIEQYGKYEQQLTKLNQEFPEKLKKSILQQAIQGKLVPQNPEDEPATKLLEKIKQEKEQLIKEGKIKRNKNESTIYKKDGHWYEVIDMNNEVKCIDEEIPFEIPEIWCWVRLGQISNYQYNISIDSKDISDYEWVLDLKDIEKDTGILLNYTTKKEIKSKSKKYIFYKNDVLYCKLRPYLNKVLIADKQGYCSSEIIPITFYGNIIPQYMQSVLMSPYFVNLTTKKSYGTKMPRLGTKDAVNILLPVAPIEEECKIIEKTKSLLNVIK